MSLTKASITMQAAFAAKISDQFLLNQDLIAKRMINYFPEADKYRKKMDLNSNGMFSQLVCLRKKFYYDRLTNSKNYDQLVVLSCGLDFSCLSHSFWSKKPIFLIDHPLSFSMTKPILDRVTKINTNVAFISIDFNTSDCTSKFATELTRSNFDFNKPTLFIWEGSSYYLEKMFVFKLLQFISHFTSTKALIFDYIADDFDKNIDNLADDETQGLEDNLNYVAHNNEPWKSKFSKDEIYKLVQKPYGFNNIKLETDLEVIEEFKMHWLEYKLMFVFATLM